MGGGTERVMSDMANYWNRCGWQITFVTWSNREVEDFYELCPGINRVWIDKSTPDRSRIGQIRSNIVRIRKLRGLLSDVKPVAVLSFIDTSNIRTIVAAMGLKLRVIVSERTNPGHSFGIPWQWRILRKKLYRYATIVVAQTADAARWIEQECSIKAHVIANPLRQLPEITNERERLILAVGRLSSEKGFDLLLRAFANTRTEFTNWRLVIIGSGPDRSELLSWCMQLSLADCVEFKEPVADIESWMSRASLVVQPSRFEGFPNVVLEAMGMGAAVISADCHSGPGEIIHDGVDGRLVPVEDIAALTYAMIELMSEPALRNRMGLKATKVRQSYGQDRIMTEWEACLRGGDSENPKVSYDCQ